MSALVETKAVDFEALGQALARFGPTMALEMDYEDGFCGTMRGFVRAYRLGPTFGGQPGIDELGGVSGELQG